MTMLYGVVFFVTMLLFLDFFFIMVYHHTRISLHPFVIVKDSLTFRGTMVAVPLRLDTSDQQVVNCWARYLLYMDLIGFNERINVLSCM